MTYDSGSSDRASFESAHSAHDGDLADSLAIDNAVNNEDDAAPGLATSPSPAPVKGRGRHAVKKDNAQSDVRRPDPAEDDTAVFAALSPDGSPVEIPFGRHSAIGDGATLDGAATRRRRRKGKRRKAPWWELPLLVAVAILIAVVVKTFVIQPFFIPSGSMEQTLHGCPGCKGDRILVNKPIYDLRDPHPGDIVVFHAPPGWEEATPKPPANPVVKAVRGFGQLVGFVPPDGLVLVKRVIAIGGQTVKGVSVGGHDQIMVSDHGNSGPWHTLKEPYTYYDQDDSKAVFAAVAVPKGRLWVMGDHRNNSSDSRFHCGDGPAGSDCDPITSTVPVKDVIGKAVVIAWPPSRWRTLGTPSTFKSGSLAVAGAAPVGGATLVILPVYLVRRRRRCRRL